MPIVAGEDLRVLLISSASRTETVKPFLPNCENICREAKMAKSNGAKAKAGGSPRTAYWQQKYMTKVLCDGHCSFAKLLFMRIASFGERGCWMTNETLGEEFNRTDRTIRSAVSSLWQSGDLIITGWNGHGRKMYAAGNQKVKDELNMGYDRAMKKGRIKGFAEYCAKIRLRPKPDNPQN